MGDVFGRQEFGDKGGDVCRSVTSLVRVLTLCKRVGVCIRGCRVDFAQTVDPAVSNHRSGSSLFDLFQNTINIALCSDQQSRRLYDKSLDMYIWDGPTSPSTF
jgi:hypothetical protein